VAINCPPLATVDRRRCCEQSLQGIGTAPPIASVGAALALVKVLLLASVPGYIEYAGIVGDGAIHGAGKQLTVALVGQAPLMVPVLLKLPNCRTRS